jgi:hypothetical protein
MAQLYYSRLPESPATTQLRRGLGAALVACLLMAPALPAAGFPLLRLDADARSAARGESSLAAAVGLAGFRQNPAALATVSRDEAAFVYLDHLLDIQLLSAGWAGARRPGLRYALQAERLDWGSLDGRDAGGEPTGSFRAGETRVAAGLARAWPGVSGGELRTGLGLGLLESSIGSARATVLHGDLGAQWSRGGISLGAAARNLGRVLSDYGSSSTTLPRLLELGFAHRLAHLPFTWSLAWQRPRGEEAVVKAGGEFQIAGRWQLGFGYHSGRGDDRIAGVDGDGLRGISAGVGGEIPGGVRFHWAWSSYGELGSLNRFSLGYRFR